LLLTRAIYFACLLPSFIRLSTLRWCCGGAFWTGWAARPLDSELPFLLSSLIACCRITLSPFVLGSGIEPCCLCSPLLLTVVASIMPRDAHWFSPHGTAGHVIALPLQAASKVNNSLWYINFVKILSEILIIDIQFSSI
jgi:hypothetical protein